MNISKNDFISAGFHILEKPKHLIVTTPQIFASGDPARFWVREDFNKLLFDDYGFTHNSVSLSLPNPDNAMEVIKQQLDKLDTQIIIDDFALIRHVDKAHLNLAIKEYLDIFSLLTNYQPKTAQHQDIMQILDSIYAYLARKYHSIEQKVKYKGLSGIEHKFAFQADNTLIDFAKPNSKTTGALLRKIHDVQTVYNDKEFSIVLDDTDERQFNKESRILSTVSNITPYSLVA